MLLITIAYLAIIVAAALFAEKRGRNFWNVVVISLLITPLFLISLHSASAKKR